MIPPRDFYLGALVLRGLSHWIDSEMAMLTTRRAEDINQGALEFLQDRGGAEAPFLLFLNYMDAHEPHTPGSPFKEMFPGKMPLYELVTLRSRKNEINSGKREMQLWEQEHIMAQYDAGIVAEDSAIGELIDTLKELGLYENTLIVVTADHGHAIGEHGYLGHGLGTVYQEEVHIPLLVKYPGQQDAARADFPVSQVDLLPTILDTVGINLPSASLPGQSLRQPVPGATFTEAVSYDYPPRKPLLAGVRHAMFEGPRKLIVWSDGEPELYDLSEDPGEQDNLYNPDDPDTQEMLTRLNSWIATQSHSSGE